MSLISCIGSSKGEENLADTGTRPDQVGPETVHPKSDWILGKQWMKESCKKSLGSGVIRKAKNIKIEHQSRKKIRKDWLKRRIM